VCVADFFFPPAATIDPEKKEKKYALMPGHSSTAAALIYI
jgi:hypothetical protein